MQLPSPNKQIIVSAIALAAQIALLTLGLDWALNGTLGGNELAAVNVIGTLFTMVCWRDAAATDRTMTAGLDTPLEWVCAGAAGACIAMLSLWHDCGYQLPSFRPAFVCSGTPGIGVLFTFAAAGVTMVALTSALRAWLLLRWRAGGVT